MKPFLIGFLILVASGFIYERVGEREDRARFPQAGRSFDVGGRSLNINCLGQGTPTVIFEGNWGEPGYAWVPTQRKIAKLTRACWYDRAGYGWSDPGPFPHHSDSVARDLHKLLEAAAIRPPYLLAGNSMGAFHVRVYNGFYPGETAGMVLIDPMNEDMTIHIHNHIEAFRPVVVSLFGFAAAAGVWRLLESDPDPAPEAYTAAEWRTLWHLEHEPKSIAAQPKEPPLWVNGEMARASGGLRDLPLIVLSAGRPTMAEDVKLENEPLKLELHRMLTRSSTRGKQVIVDCGHEISRENPDAIVAAIRDVLEQVTAPRRNKLAFCEGPPTRSCGPKSPRQSRRANGSSPLAP